MRRFVLATLTALLLQLTGPLLVHAQGYFDDYSPLQASGQIPKEFRQDVDTRVEQEVSKAVRRSDRRSTRKTKEQFVMRASYFIDQLLQSGRVLFNDPVTNYVNQVADRILSDQPELRRQLQFYVVKSTAVNAFTTDRGIIFVNLGLLAQLTSEAQLAFILCHEIHHFKEKDNIERYMEMELASSQQGVYKNMNWLDKLLAISKYSRTQEAEADEGGLELYKQTDYSYAEVNIVFDVLLYSYLPFEQTAWNHAYFDGEYFQLPQMLRLPEDEVNEITVEADYEDTLNTHPNIETRRNRMQARIEKLDNAGRSAFLGEADLFKWVRDIARFECTRLRLMKRSYERAIYNAFLLQQAYPNAYFCRKTIAKSLYGLARYCLSDNEDEVHYDPDEVEGASQPVYYMIDRFEGKYLGMLALRELWQLHRDYPQNQWIRSMSRELAYELYEESDFSAEDYTLDLAEIKAAAAGRAAAEAGNTSETAGTTEDHEAAEKASDGRDSKYAAINTKRNERDMATEMYLAFAPFHADTAFAELLAEVNDRVAEHQSERDGDDDDDDEREPILAGERLMFIDPMDEVYDLRKDQRKRLSEGEALRKLYIASTETVAGDLGYDVRFFRPRQLNASETQRFNDAALASEFIRERVSHIGDDIYHMNVEEVEALAARYETRYFGVGGLVKVRSRELLGLKIGYTILMPPLIIFTLPDMLTPDGRNLMYIAMYDIKTGRMKLFFFRKVNQYMSGSLLRAHLYDVYHQMKTGQF